MSKFNPKEISLCKQVAEKHRRDMKCGDWFYHVEDESCYVWIMDGRARTDIPEVWFPLWTISDCILWLREKGFRYSREDYRVIDLDSSELVQIIISGGKKKYCRRKLEGKTPLIACLKAVLAVLEDSK